MSLRVACNFHWAWRAICEVSYIKVIELEGPMPCSGIHLMLLGLGLAKGSPPKKKKKKTTAMHTFNLKYLNTPSNCIMNIKRLHR